jgi:adenylate kinase family enzyme
MKRVLVIGSGGSGKSTFARRLGELLNIQVKHLDSFYWRPGWQETPKEEWLAKVKELRIQHCDTIVFLDLPRLLCVWRIAKRRLLYRGRSRPDMGAGCPEKLDWEFVSWVWGYSRRSRPKIVKLLQEHSGTKQIVWLRSRAGVKKFLDELSS